MSYGCLQRGVFGVLVAYMLLCARSGSAQATEPPRYPQLGHTCTAQAAFSFTEPFGKDGGNFEHGYGFLAGGGVSLTPSRYGGGPPVLFFNINYFYDSANATPAAIAAAMSAAGSSGSSGTSSSSSSATISTRGIFSVVSWDPSLRWYTARGQSFYVTGDFGWLRRNAVQYTSSESTIFSLTNGKLEQKVTNSGEIGAGVGASRAIARYSGLEVFAEARFYKGLAINHNLILVPIFAGIRW